MIAANSLISSGDRTGSERKVGCVFAERELGHNFLSFRKKGGSCNVKVKHVPDSQSVIGMFICIYLVQVAQESEDSPPPRTFLFYRMLGKDKPALQTPT